MTTDERFAKIESVIESLLERHIQHAADIEKQNAAIRDLTASVEKQNSGIRDLIVVGRTVLDAQMRTDGQIQQLLQAQQQTDHSLKAFIDESREARKYTDAKLNVLIDTVDRIIRRDGRNES